MKATLDKIQQFLVSPVSYALLKNNDSFRESYYSQSRGEALPLTEHYYHPLNPCFLFELTGPAIMQHSPIITVRDGVLTFMDFLLNNHQALSHWGTLFIIPKVYEKLIPKHLAHFFIGYEITQSKKTVASEKFIFAYLTEEYLARDIDVILEKLNDLKDDDKCTLFLPQETNLEKVSYNNIFVQEFIFKLSHRLKDHAVRHINTHDFLNTTDFSRFDFIDLAYDHFLVYDHFIKFLMASRGCQSCYEAPSQQVRPILSLNLSMYHQMNLYELAPAGEIFSELLMYRKQYPHRKLMEDTYFSTLLRNLMNSAPHKA